MDRNEAIAETPEVILSELGRLLRSSEGIDADLAKIIAEHLLVSTPKEDSVEQALAAIVAVAEMRAKAGTERTDA